MTMIAPDSPNDNAAYLLTKFDVVCPVNTLLKSIVIKSEQGKYRFDYKCCTFSGTYNIKKGSTAWVDIKNKQDLGEIAKIKIKAPNEGDIFSAFKYKINDSGTQASVDYSYVSSGPGKAVTASGKTPDKLMTTTTPTAMPVTSTSSNYLSITSAFLALFYLF